MAWVFFDGNLRRHTSGLEKLEIDVTSYRDLLEALEQRYPGIEADIEGKMMVAIDGEMIFDPFLESISPHSEVHFLPKITAG